MYGHIRHSQRLLSPRVGTLQISPLSRIGLRRHYQTSKAKKQIAADAQHLDADLDDAKPRAFAIERVGGRECHISWTERGVTKEWRELVSVQEQERGVSTTGSFVGRVASSLRQMFLPTNYPQSVHRSYMPFHILQFFETTFGTVVSVLCNQALLTSVGMSAEGSIFGAVAVQWIIKDGAGEVAKLFFIRQFSPYFDSHPKSFTLFGEGIVALGSGLQIATLLVTPTPVNFLLCAAGGNVFKLVGYAIWFTTHIKWVRYFATQGNMGDVAAKDESQNSIAQLLGYAAGIGLLTFSHSPAYLYSLFAILTPAHLAMTTLMMRVATFEVLTLPRLSMLANDFAGGNKSYDSGTVMSLRDMDRAREIGAFGEFYKRKEQRYVDLAPRVGDVVGSDPDVESVRWQVCTDVLKREKYLLYPDSSSDKPIAVFYHPDASCDDILRSVVHAARLRGILGHSPLPSGSDWHISPIILRQALKESHVWTLQNCDDFKRALKERGWRTDEVAFADRGHRLLWGPEADRGS